MVPCLAGIEEVLTNFGMGPLESCDTGCRKKASFLCHSIEPTILIHTQMHFCARAQPAVCSCLKLERRDKEKPTVIWQKLETYCCPPSLITVIILSLKSLKIYFNQR